MGGGLNTSALNAAVNIFGATARAKGTRNSQRSIVWATGVARVTVAKLLKKAWKPSPPLPRLRRKKAHKKRWEVLELDEMLTFVLRL